VVPVQVPALRERPDDIVPLADYLLKRLAPELGRPALTFSAAARAAMASYAWPGNVRELSNAVERAVITAEGDEIQVNDLCMDEVLPPAREAPAGPSPAAGMAAVAASAPAALPRGALLIPPGQRNLAEIEALLIRAALDETGGQKSRAADLLGINRTTLYNKLRELNLMPTASDGEASEASAS
jgi:DNA-binding NtrC family response regulator